MFKYTTLTPEQIEHDLLHLRTASCSICREIADRLAESQAKDKEVEITYRGWPGHFIAARYCIFRLNTLVRVGEVRYVVSTVGNEQVRSSLIGKWEQEPVGGPNTFYETMAFRAALRDGYWDQESGHSVHLNGKWRVDHIDLTSDAEAQEMHESAVKEIVDRILNGELT